MTSSIFVNMLLVTLIRCWIKISDPKCKSAKNTYLTVLVTTHPSWNQHFHCHLEVEQFQQFPPPFFPSPYYLVQM